jgi:hypothetical protein
MALRCEETERYATGRLYTFYSYYWDESSEQWRLYGVGQKYHRGFKSLGCSTFVEVPGVAEVQRTNHVTRSVLYQGFCRDKSTQKWHSYDQLKPHNVGSTYTNKRWGLTNDNRFYVSAGGLEQVPVSTFKDKVRSNPLATIPKHMNADKLKAITNPVPFPVIVSHSIITPNGNKYHNLKINIKDRADDNTVVVYSGPKDGLTIANEWKRSKRFTGVKTGTVDLRIPFDIGNKYFRVLVKNNHNQLFNFSTFSVDQ